MPAVASYDRIVEPKDMASEGQKSFRSLHVRSRVSSFVPSITGPVQPDLERYDEKFACAEVASSSVSGSKNVIAGSQTPELGADGIIELVECSVCNSQSASGYC